MAVSPLAAIVDQSIANERQLVMSRVSDMARVGGLVRRASPALAIAAVLSSVGVAVVVPAIAYTSLRMFDAILVAHSEAETIRWMSIEIGLAVTVTVFTCLQQDTSRLLREPLALEMSTALARTAAAMPLTDLESPATRDQLSQARVTAGTRAGQLVEDMLTVLQVVVSLAICALVISRYTGLAILTVVAVIPGVIVEVWSARALHRASERLSHDQQRFDLLEETILSGPCSVENKFLDAGRPLSGRLRAIGDRLGAEQLRVWRRAGLPAAIAQLLPTVAYYGVQLYLGLQAARGTLSFGAFTMCLIVMYNVQYYLQQALVAGRSASETWIHLRGYFELIDGPARPPALPPARVGAPRLATGAAPLGLRLRDVGFRYPGSEAWALRHVDLDVAPGEVVGIVGGNGSGKSTLVRILTGLYRPGEGTITLDGRDLSEWDEAALRARFAVTFQDFARYRMSLRENLVLPPADGDDELRLAEAFAASGVDQLLPDLPRGLDTALSASFGAGVELSGGQWQKVALARAFARREADHLILDEPTSALDARSEERVLEHVAARRRKQTIVLITHRLSALRSADRVVLLEKGRASVARA